MAKCFHSANELSGVFETLFKTILSNSRFGEKVKDLGKNLKFNFNDPNTEITIALDKGKWSVKSGPGNVKADIEFWLSGDSAHRLWSGKVTPISAIMSREIRAKGPIRAMNEIASLFASSQDIYRKTLKKFGREDLLS